MSWKYFNKKTVDRSRMYEIIRSPVITEKSTLGSEFNQVTFKVPLDATKPEIRAAVEGLLESRRRLGLWVCAGRVVDQGAAPLPGDVGS